MYHWADSSLGRCIIGLKHFWADASLG